MLIFESLSGNKGEITLDKVRSTAADATSARPGSFAFSLNLELDREAPDTCRLVDAMYSGKATARAGSACSREGAQ